MDKKANSINKDAQEINYNIDRAIENEKFIKESASKFILENMRDNGIIAIRQMNVEEVTGNPLYLGQGRNLQIIEIFGCATKPEICYTDKDDSPKWETVKEYPLGLESLKSIVSWFQSIMNAFKEGKLILEDGTLVPNLVRVER